VSEARACIGLEVHVQLATATKLFCGDVVDALAPPNTHVCPVCLGLPGALPVTNRRAVELALRTALGLDCTVHEWSTFERKSYFYPDLPRGYQITQATRPLATGGQLDGVRIRSLHIEEDAGRLIHDRFEPDTAVDFNRAGTPLVEIVTEPELESPAAARSFLQRLRRVLLYLGVSDCEMEHGSLRVDANVSLRAGRDGQRTELKNLNSFAHVERALDFEIARLAAPATPAEASTRQWDDERKRTTLLRSKEPARDYRYQPEPDLPPVRVDARMRERAAAELPELPDAVEARFAAAYDMPPAHIDVLTGDPALARYFEEVAAHCDPRDARSWVMTDVLGWLNRHGSRVDSMPVPPAALAELIELVRKQRVARPAARRAFEIMAERGGRAADVVAANDLERVGDEAALVAWADSVIEAFPDEAARCRNGEMNVLTFLIGQLMRISGGRADPQRGAAVLRARIVS
jgi:aspartyl-tRNA(Asn)/glutamyl-tRNA(Gln) amidotransferase subunit B